MYQEIQNVKFSELIKHNNNLFKFSPKGHTFAVAVHRKLNIWDSEFMEISQRFLCQHSIELFEWSFDSELIFCVIEKKNIVQVFYLCDPDWQCNIEESCLGIADIRWAPDSRHILITSEFYVRMSIWSLVSRNVSHIQNLKAIKSAICFTPCSKYLVLAERKDFKDYIGVYTCDTWELIKKFPVETKNLSEIQVSPSGYTISAVASMTEGFKVLFYSIDGRQLGNYTSDIDFGVRSLTWDPKNSCIAVGNFNEKIQLLDGRKFNLILQYEHPEVIETEDVNVYKVVERSVTSSVFSQSSEKYELIKRRPVSVPCFLHKSEESKIKHPAKHGIQTLKFSNDGRYIASINGSMPRVVWIFSMKKLAISDILVQSHNIKNISWHPVKPLLAISTGTASVYIWTPDLCFLINSPFPDSLFLNNVSWCPGKEVAILNGKGNSSVLRIS